MLNHLRTLMYIEDHGLMGVYQRGFNCYKHFIAMTQTRIRLMRVSLERD